MGKFFKSTNETIERPIVVYKALPYGPITRQASADRVTARSADGSVVCEVMTDAQYKGTDESVRQLADGVDVHINGERVGRLVQNRTGFARSKRVIRLEWLDDARWPQGAYFRARGIAGVTLEHPGGRLIASRYRKPKIRDDRVTPELVVLYTAVISPLGAAVFSTR